MRLLFLNHTSLVSGGERCLLDLLAALGDGIDPLVACPRGPLLDEARALGVNTTPMIGTAGSLRLHPIGTPRALAELGAATVALRALAARRQIDLVHANSVRSALVASAARRAGGPPLAAFIHDVLPPGRVTDTITATVRSQASLLLANSAFAAERFGIAPGDRRLRVVHNPINLQLFDPARHPRAAARAGLELGADALVLAVVAQITPWKAQSDALKILDLLRVERSDATLIVAGEPKFAARSARYDNRSYHAELQHLVRDRGLEAHVRWLGERSDVPAILAAADVLLVPSWEEPFGRIVVEGMAMGCLVAATSAGGPAEIVSDGVDGLLLAPRDPRSWARALLRLLERPAVMQAIRAAAPHAAARFDRDSFARAVQAGYAGVRA